MPSISTYNKSHAELFLDAAKNSKKDNVYYVGPFARRVSFASQQQRALNLVWALDKMDLPRADSSIAIVGCGIAGLTCAAALIMSGRNPWLFEKSGRVLDLQSEAYHRFVHPSINFWPEMKFEPTTMLPVFDWFADDCVNVLERMRSEWTDHFDEEVADLYLNVEVADVEDTEKGARVVLDRPDSSVRTEFDIAIVATGFGKERTNDMSCSNSYWELDSLERKRLRNFPEYIISGCGDGGLIDSLRLVHSEFSNGKLASELLHKIDSAANRAKIEKFEKRVQYGDEQREGERSLLRAREYSKVLKEIGRGARRLLNKSLIRTGGKVTLISGLPTPFGDGSAPIYKLMLAHALSEDAIEYRQGRVTCVDDELKYSDIDGKVESISPDVYVARHGAERWPIGVSDKKERDEFRDSQGKIADYLLKSIGSTGVFGGFGAYPAHDPTDRKFANYRLPYAAKCMESYSDSAIRVVLQEDDSNGAIVPVYAFDASMRIKRPPPSRLFGVPLVDRPVDTVDEL